MHGTLLRTHGQTVNQVQPTDVPAPASQPDNRPYRQPVHQPSRNSGAIEDLPAQCRSGSRRQLTPLENMERDAIVASLTANAINKAKAAAEVGMSRATIDRKIRKYGIHDQLAPDTVGPTNTGR